MLTQFFFWRKRTKPILQLTVDELEPDEPETEPEPEVARAAKEVINGRGKRGQKRKSAAQEVEVALIIDAPVPWRAPVAWMI